MATPDLPPLVPARMLNEYAYCPRLAYLEWVQGEWADNVETLEGKHAHRRVDREATRGEGIHRRSLHLSSERLGLTAVIDLVEGDGDRVRPVDYKRGAKPAVAGGAWEPERVQLCAQGLLNQRSSVQSMATANPARGDVMRQHPPPLAPRTAFRDGSLTTEAPQRPCRPLPPAPPLASRRRMPLAISVYSRAVSASFRTWPH